MLFRLAALSAVAAALSAAEPIKIGQKEVVVVMGDWIADTNWWPGLLECYLHTRFPGKETELWNLAWPGEAAADADKRWGRDVAPYKPSLALLPYGLNDGHWGAWNQKISDAWLKSQRELIRVARAGQTRVVLVSPNPIDPDRRHNKDVYNDTLAHLTADLGIVSSELKAPVIDLFTPMRKLQSETKARTPGWTFAPDGVGPNPVGHLVMAYHILQAIEGPKEVGVITLGEGVTATGGITIDKVERHLTGWRFEMTLPFLPLWVPEAAREGLELVPFQQDLNRLMVKAEKPEQLGYTITIDGKEAKGASGDDISAGIDIAPSDRAPWGVQGRQLWGLVQRRFAKHRDSWRPWTWMDHHEDKALMQEGASVKVREAGATFAKDILPYMRKLAKPGTYRVEITRTGVIPVDAVELSPLYPYTGDFEGVLPPEKDAASVAWRRRLLDDEGLVDLNRAFGGQQIQCAVFARLRFKADKACKLRLDLGSDDGLLVIHNGKRVLSRNVGRGVKRGDDRVDLSLTEGENTVLLRVNQGAGGFGLAVAAKVIGENTVRLVR